HPLRPRLAPVRWLYDTSDIASALATVDHFHGLRPALRSPNISADHPRCAVRLACEPGGATGSSSPPGVDHQLSCSLTSGRLLDDDGRANRGPLVEEGHGAEGHIDAAVRTVREGGARTI